MNLFLLALITSTMTLSQSFSDSHIQKLKSLKEISLADLTHENPGCPENSKCSKQNGTKRQEWIKALYNYNKTKKVSYINNFISKYGHPVKFLIKEEDSTSLDPIIFSSKCEKHKKLNIVEATLFLKSLPKNKKLIFTKIESTQGQFKIPYGNRILGFKNGNVISILEDNNTIYTSLISKDLKFKAIELTEKELNLLLENKESLNCEKQIKSNEYFLAKECYKVFDLDKKKKVEIIQDWSCL